MIINYENIIKYFFKDNLPAIFRRYEKHKFNKYENRVKLEIARYRERYAIDGRYPLFGTIEIETLNRCNNSCSFCPVNKNADTRQFQLMDEQLFISIINQLKELEYGGSIGLYSNNEPFLDERIIHLAKITKDALPNNTLYLYTNGTLLTIEKFDAIMQYLDRMYIDNYNDRLKLITPVKAVHNYCVKNKKYLDKVRIRLRKLNDALSTRGGQAPNRKQEIISTFTFGCLLPFRQMVVRPDGKVSLCCNDALGKMTLGDLNHESIEAIWHGQAFLNFREKLAVGRHGMDLCNQCDSLL